MSRFYIETLKGSPLNLIEKRVYKWLADSKNFLKELEGYCL